ncbi:MAG: HI0074 family nucleotidyltransferase substrate-binding subunit [Treponema sp.]|jgi:nucleotidyltransferase substrate binding protein (TIGR01987 family)|nr:HI0074 family nucleotidyltransferase substrate-binding subunit [Treponema sp.]
MEIIVEPLEKALISLKEAWVEFQKNTANTFVRDSVIQRFEYAFEMSHKFLRRFLSETEPNKAEVSEMFFNELIRLGCKRGLLLNDLETWDKYRKLRNLTSHNYDEFNSESIILIIPVFIEDIDYQLVKIKEKTSQQTIFIHIDENHKKLIISLLREIPEINNCSVYLFGSRVNGKSVNFSDVDIAIDYEGKVLPDNFKLQLSSSFENSLLPYKVDIIDLNSVSPVFKTKIEKDFVKII